MRETNGTSAEQRRWKISRRTFLRGVGVTMALPYLESFSAFGQTAHPKRLAVLFWGNGVNSNHWWAKGSGAEMELGKSLEPLAPFCLRPPRPERADVERVAPQRPGECGDVDLLVVSQDDHRGLLICSRAREGILGPALDQRAGARQSLGREKRAARV